ncbi:hypothetical protein HJC23_004796 [Cyclotella cryptica]|uniref:Orc1-like AAA ATPase domain-containing protein n=1 Tax=Cyclotella cryptica TaxID=29204 RepID=A0ABD3PZP1_9STRA
MTTVPLRRWIKASKEQATALSSTYLECSLRIAISITRQIGDAESGAASHGPALLPPPFPTASLDWVDFITVCLESTGETVEWNSEALSPSERNSLTASTGSSPSDNTEELLHKIAQDAKQEGEESQIEENEWIERAESRENVDYLRVRSAQIVYVGGTNQVPTRREKRNRIYSLGLVFYELFSGGMLPPPALLISSTNDDDGTVDQGEGRGCATNNEDNAGPWVDFASAVNVSDEVGGRLPHDNVESNGCNDWYVTASIPNKRRQTPLSSVHSMSSGQSLSSPGTIPVLGKISVEYLVTKGVPRPLCDLICNMIDCVNGDFMSDDSYEDMSHVLSDLQLMLEKPSIFLHNLDVDKLSRTGLELNDIDFVRDNEYVSLQCAYQRSIEGSSEMAIITGLSGTGKSTLANRLGHYVVANGGLFLSGKFDQMQQAKPFSAVASAFNNFCDALATQEESEHARLVASKLRTALGSDLYYLAQVIPNLSQLLKENFCHQSSSHDCVNAQSRLHYLFCQFVDVIASCFEGPVTLFMDDVQWADSSSISIIGQLLKMSRSFKNKKHLFFLGCCRNDEMGSDHPFWKMVESVNVLGFKTAVVKLDVMDRDTVNQAVSMLLHLSPRLVRSLSDIVYQKTKGNPLFVSRLLRSLNREGLLRISLTRHRWEWDEEKIQSRKLPDDVANFFVQSINSLSCDVKVALSFLSCFGASTDCAVIQGLENYLQMRLTEPLNVAIDEGLVSKLGQRYYFSHDRLQEAAYSMINEQHRCQQHMNYGLALMNLSAIDLSSGNKNLFFTAVMQINLGGPSAVQGNAEQYYLISSYNLMAGKKAMEMSDFASAFAFFEQGILFLRENHWQEQYDLSLELFNLAAKCALTIKRLTRLDMICNQLLQNARSFEEDTLNISLISASALTFSKVYDSVRYCLIVLSQLGVNIPESASRDDTLNLVTQTQSLLNSIADDTLLNYQVMADFKKIMAMKFLAKLELSVLQTNPALQPFVTIKMCELSMEYGLSPMSAVGFAYFGGMVAELGDVRGGHRYTKLAKMLIEKFQSNEYAGEVIWLATEILHYIEPYQTANEYRIGGQRTAIAAGDVHWACMHKLLYSSSLPHLGVSLSVTKEAMDNACCTRDPLWAERGKHYKEKITTWKQEGSLWNFENKSFLLHAEEYYSNGDFDNAQVMYDKAILSARQHKFVHEEALACELAGNFYLNRGNALAALKHFTFAHGKYLQWGAFAKVKMLYAFIQETFGDAFVAAHVGAGSDDLQFDHLNTDIHKKRSK